MPRLWLALLAAAAVAAPAAAQDAAADVRYWPMREINFPIPVERLSRDPVRPKRLHFFVAERGGAWKEAAARGLNDLDLIDAERQTRGFRYVAPRDGAYEFALQLESDAGDLAPRTADLVPQYRVVVDTRPPFVRAARVGRTGLEWDVSDENLADDPVRLEARWVRDSESPAADFANAKFVPVEPGGFRPKAADRFDWRELRPGDVLEVRVVARDKANQETASPPVRLPGDDDAGGIAALPPASGYGSPDDFAGGRGSPARVYSNTRTLKITSKLDKITRSGVVKSYLWVRDSGMKWLPAGEQPQNITDATKDPEIVWDHAVKSDGLFGFIVIAENAAGKKNEKPRDGDPPQFLIEVDTVKPEAQITGATVSGTGKEPRVTVNWTARDANFDSSPIMLEYAETPSAPAGSWKPLHQQPNTLPNTGSYVWAVSDPKLWKFYLRIRAKDLAGNEQTSEYKEPVIVDLDTPKATIETIAGNGRGPQAGNTADPVRTTAGSGVEPGKNPVAVPRTPEGPVLGSDGKPLIPELPPESGQKPQTP